MPEPSLMELSKGGGCGCKISPAILQELLVAAGPATSPAPAQLLVGNATADDCAAWQLNNSQVLVATTDFFMPVVNDPHDFGRIAATNALSDIYAMGAQPTLALALVGMPTDKLSPSSIGAILAGGQAACAAAGVPIAGGHTIESSEPIYGLAVSGLCTPAQLSRNDTASLGDVLILGKSLGIGILSAALRQGKLDAEGYAQLVTSTTTLNRVGARLAAAGLVTAMTDVTGFGLLGHALEMCRGANLQATINFSSVPLFPIAKRLAQTGTTTGASNRNWDSYRTQVTLQDCEPWQQALLTDPQTSGGLLLACQPANVDAALALLHELECPSAATIGSFTASGAQPSVVVQA